MNYGRQPACWWQGPRLWSQTTWLCHFLALGLRASPFTSQARTQMSTYAGNRKVLSENEYVDPHWLNTWENSPQWVRVHVCNKLDSIPPPRISNARCSNCSKNCWQDTIKSMNSKLLKGIPWQPVVRTLLSLLRTRTVPAWGTKIPQATQCAPPPPETHTHTHTHTILLKTWSTNWKHKTRAGHHPRRAGKEPNRTARHEKYLHRNEALSG